MCLSTHLGNMGTRVWCTRGCTYLYLQRDLRICTWQLYIYEHQLQQRQRTTEMCASYRLKITKLGSAEKVAKKEHCEFTTRMPDQILKGINRVALVKPQASTLWLQPASHRMSAHFLHFGLYLNIARLVIHVASTMQGGCQQFCARLP